jgi:UMF1 family MFS transporter
MLPDLTTGPTPSEALSAGGRDPGTLSSTGEVAASRWGQFCWALIEGARSPYLAFILIYVFPSYFAREVVGDPVRGQALWGSANTAVSILIGALAPFVGAIADRQGRRKPWLAAVFVVMAAGCCSLWYAMPGANGGLSIAAILTVTGTLLGCFLISEVFHNSMLPSIAQSDRLAPLSGLGLSLNGVAVMLSMSMVLICFALPASGMLHASILPARPLWGLDPARQEHIRIVGPLASVWLIALALPFMIWTPDREASGIGPRQAVREGWSQIVRTVREARRLKNVGRYLIARMFYNDGKVAIAAYSGIYAVGTFKWGIVQILLFGMLLTPPSMLGGLLTGRLESRFGGRGTINLSVGVTSLALLGAISCGPDRIFFLHLTGALKNPVWSFAYFNTLPELVFIGMYMIIGCFIAVAFATSRSMMARIAPKSMLSQFFGLYALSGNATAFMGHGMVTLFTQVFASQAVGLASTLILLAIGLLLMRGVREERAPDL